MELLKEAKVKGYLFQQQNYVPTEGFVNAANVGKNDK